jgi:hypothetical protein
MCPARCRHPVPHRRPRIAIPGPERRSHGSIVRAVRNQPPALAALRPARCTARDGATGLTARITIMRLATSRSTAADHGTAGTTINIITGEAADLPGSSPGGHQPPAGADPSFGLYPNEFAPTCGGGSQIRSGMDFLPSIAPGGVHPFLRSPDRVALVDDYSRPGVRGDVRHLLPVRLVARQLDLPALPPAVLSGCIPEKPVRR